MRLNDLVASLKDRRPTVERVVEYARRLFRGRTFVETGTWREDNGEGTLWLSILARETGSKFYSIDVDPTAQDRAIGEAQRRGIEMPRTTFVVGDSAAQLAELNGPISLLYLDSMDAYTDKHTTRAYHRHQLAEIQTVHRLLTDDAIILLDDDYDDGGKAHLSRPWLVKHGWKMIMREYQSVFVRCP